MNALETIFQAVVDTSWRASCLILLLLGLRRWVRGQVAARLLFWVWIAVALRLLLPISLPTAWSPFNLASWSRLSGPGPTLPARPGLPTLEAVPPSAATGQVSLSNRAFASTPIFSPGAWAALVWLSGAVVLLWVRISACARFARKLKRSGIPPGPAGTSLLAEASRPLNASGVEVLITDAVCAPALHGIVRPRILFPPGFLEKLSPAEIRLAVAHELAHARRRDLLADAIIHLAVVVHWFNPLVWLAARTARHDCELACDETVLRRVTGSERECYGATLLRIARLTIEAPRPGFTLGVVASKGQIKRRIQMIVANKTFTLSGTLLGGVVAVAITGLSFTSEITAQTTTLEMTSPTLPPKVAATPDTGPSPSNIVYNPSIDRLDVLFPTGIVATVADRSITVAEVRSYIAPLIPQLQRDTRTQEEFNGRLTLLQNSAVKDLVTRTLLIRQFHDKRDGEQAKAIPPEYIDTYIADNIAERFDGDRRKFLDYLKEKGQTQRDYRKEVEENIIYNYMRSQERKMAGNVSQPKAEPEVRPIRLRLIQLTRTEGESDATLMDKANAILVRFKNGENFENLAKEFDQSGRGDRGGDWGWQGAADLRTEYRDLVLALKKGEVGGPIVAKEACLLFYAEDRR